MVCCVVPFSLVVTVKTLNIVHVKLPYQHLNIFRSVNTCKTKTVVGPRSGTRLVTALTLTKVTLILNNDNIMICTDIETKTTKPIFNIILG